MSLVEHAVAEMRSVGLYDNDSDYAGMLGTAVEDLVRVFAAQGHSGFSAHQTLRIFGIVARFKPLGPLTDNPDEWMDVSQYGGTNDPAMCQSRRQCSCFSCDGGKTYYDVDERQAWWRRLLPRRAPLTWRLTHRKTWKTATELKPAA